MNRLLIIIGYMAGQKSMGREKPEAPPEKLISELLAEAQRVTRE